MHVQSSWTNKLLWNLKLEGTSYNFLKNENFTNLQIEVNETVTKSWNYKEMKDGDYYLEHNNKGQKPYVTSYSWKKTFKYFTNIGNRTQSTSYRGIVL